MHIATEDLNNYELLDLYKLKFKDSPTTVNVDIESDEFRTKLLESLNSGDPISEDYSDGRLI